MTHHTIPGYLHNARHQLDQVDFRLHLPPSLLEGPTGLSATGRSATSRTALWTYQEEFDVDTTPEKGYEAHDAIAHICLVAIQDRPSSVHSLNLALRGGVAWSQDELF